MKRLMPLCFLALLTLRATAQPNPNLVLKHELDSIYVLDQRYRELLGLGLTPRARDSVAAALGVAADQAQNQLIRRMLDTDSSNIRRISQIIQQHGYPGKSLVGVPTNEVAFYVIQHSNRIPKYLPLVKQAAQRGDLPFPEYAKMLDRQLMYEGKEQLYGTQGSGFTVVDRTTGKSEFKKVIWPIKNPSQVNQRRKEAGFDQTVEENAKRLNIPYQVLTLAEVKKMQHP